jgi:hypothetical protein
MSGGQTASFLKAEEPSGDQLISMLTAKDAPAAASAPAQPAAAATGPDTSVIGSLIQATTAPIAPSPAPASAGSHKAPAAKAPVQEIDTSVIGNLLGGPAQDASDDAHGGKR